MEAIPSQLFFLSAKGNVLETHEHGGDFREFQVHAYSEDSTASTNALQPKDGELIASLD